MGERRKKGEMGKGGTEKGSQGPGWYQATISVHVHAMEALCPHILPLASLCRADRHPHQYS